MNNDDKMMLGLFLVTGVMLWLAFFSAGAFGGTLPDPTLTPGVTRNLTLDQICGTKWGKDARAVTAAMKAHVYAEYHMTPHQGECALSPRGCEIDHVISRELAGADDVRNLWPQPYGGKWNAVMKDRAENEAHKRVCSGKITLEYAQHAISTNWIDFYKELFPAK
jgi:hypothetical protein